MGKTERTLLHRWWDCKLVQPIWTTGWMFLKKLNIELPYYPVIPLLGIYPEKTINVQKDTYTPIFIAALFTIAKTWNQPKWQLRVEQIKNMWGVRVCVCVCVYSKILLRHEKEKIMPFVATWMGLDTMILRDLSNTEKDKHHLILLTYGI